MVNRTQFYRVDDNPENISEGRLGPQSFASGPFEIEQPVRHPSIAAFSLPPALRTIAVQTASGRIPETWRVRKPLTLDDLEMLEAELVNQGVMEPQASVDGDGVFSVSQRAAFEIASLRWRARRICPERQFVFVVDVPRYLLHWAEELASRPRPAKKSHGRADPELKPLLVRFRELAVINEDPQAVAAQMRYLELFAQYIIGIEENVRPASRDRGLEVVLKALSDPMAQSAHCPVSLTAVLPIADGGRWLGF